MATRTKRINFTVPALKAATCPAGMDRTYLYDTKCPHLALMVTAKGAKSFYYYRKVNRRPERIRIGNLDEISIDQARDLGAKYSGQYADGKNPAEARRAIRAEITLRELNTHYLDTYAKGHKKSWKVDERLFERYLTPWQTRQISQITKANVSELHGKVGEEHGKYAANRMLSLLHALYTHAAANGFKGDNPAHGVSKFPEQERERFLQGDELPRFFKALDDEPNATLRDFFHIALLTGARRSNVQAMRWADLDTNRATWTIPAEKNKSGHPVTIALAPQAMEILKARMGNGSPYVFESYGKTGHVVEPKHTWKNILKRAALKDLRVHDLRRTLGSWQAALGSSLQIIGKSLGHRNLRTTQIYARLNLEPVQASVYAAADAIMAAGAKQLPAAEGMRPAQQTEADKQK